MAASSDSQGSSRGIDFGRGNRLSNVNISGTIAGRDVTQITTTPEAAAGVKDKEELLALIEQLQGDIAKLTEAPEGERRDAQDELVKAKEAGEKGDHERLVKKLQSAQAIMAALGSTIPAAFQLGETIGTLLQKVPGLP